MISKFSMPKNGFKKLCTVCLGSKINIFLIFNFHATCGVLLKDMIESSLLSKDEPITPNIDEVMAV